MSNFPFVACVGEDTADAVSTAGYSPVRDLRRLVRPAFRITSVAAIALAVAGCSQETQRFDYDTRSAPTAGLHYSSKPYGDDDLVSWRHSDRGGLHDPRRDIYADPITESLPEEEATHTPLRARSDRSEKRGRAAPLRERRPAPPRRATHTVRSGDTLYSIARQHGVAVDELARANRLADPGLIRVGDKLYIPDDGGARSADSYARRDARRVARRAEPPRRAARESRYSDAIEARYAEDQLYVDPLLRERAQPDDPRRARPARPAAPRTDDGRRADTRGEPARVSSAAPRRYAPVTPPPAPAQRPETREPVQPARSKPAEPTRIARLEPAAKQPKAAAECRQLMKNPPARSGANFRRPVNGLIVSRFGETADGQRNDGINISVPRGTPVKAAENGVVVYAGDELTGLGKLVLVRHADGWVSAYAHNDKILVERCDTVQRGQAIARAGVSGSVSKPQLHFELRKNARPVDPEQYLAGTS